MSTFTKSEPSCDASLKRREIANASPAPSPWLCARTFPGREDFAQRSIETLGFETYLPKYEKSVSHARRRQLVPRPLFPGYLFAAASHATGGAGAINRCPGVTSVLGGPGGQMRVHESLIEELRARETTSGLIAMSAGRFRPGQKVQVIAGAFSGFTAIFVEANDERRVGILIDLLGKSHRVSLCSSALDIAI